MKQSSKFLLTVAFALATAAITAYLLALVDTTIHFAIYAFTLWLVIPIGAMVCGALAATGYYAGFHLFPNRPPGRIFMATVVVTSIATYFLVYYLDYSMSEVKGRHISEMLSFGMYLFTAIEKRRMWVNFSNLGSLGPLNFLLAALQVVGFVIGGLWIFRLLKVAVPCCDGCDDRLHKAGTWVRPSNSLLSIEEVFHKVHAALLEGQGNQARVLMADPKPPAKPAHRLVLSIWKCARCPVEFFDLFITPGGEHTGRKRDYSPARKFRTGGLNPA